MHARDRPSRYGHWGVIVIKCLANNKKMSKQEKTQNIENVLASLIRQRDFEGKMLEQKVFSLWPEVVSEPIANHAYPTSLSAGILTVRTEHPVYQTQLSFLKVNILAELNARLGRAVVKDLRLEFRPADAAPIGARGPVPRALLTEKQRQRKKLPEKTRTQIEVALAGVADENLKASLRLLFVTQSEETDAITP